MRKLKLLCIAVLVFLTTYTLNAQVSTFSGVIKEEDGTPVVGATIRVKGTNIVTTTDEKGAFSLQNTGANFILVITSV